jgi:hypothetical protein
MMKRGIAAEYHAYCWSQAGAEPEGYSFEFELEKNVRVRGSGLSTPEARDLKAIEVAEELGIVLTDYLLSVQQRNDECKKCGGGPACPPGDGCFIPNIRTAKVIRPIDINVFDFAVNVSRLNQEGKILLVVFPFLRDMDAFERILNLDEIKVTGTVHQFNMGTPAVERYQFFQESAILLASLQVIRDGFNLSRFDEILFFGVPETNPARKYIEANFIAQNERLRLALEHHTYGVQGPTKLCAGCGRFMPIDENRALLPHSKALSGEPCEGEAYEEVSINGTGN